MKILIKPNLDKQDAPRCANEAAKVLLKIAKKRGRTVEILFPEDDKAYIEAAEGVSFGSESELLKLCDIVMPIGGDGTIMRAAQPAAKAGKPVLGINAGNLGFLSQIERTELNELERLFDGKYGILERMMLEACVENGSSASTYTALNDVVTRHGDADRIVSIEIRQGGKLIASHRADGVIFSTPTGSTAYSMSAGGPIAPPELSVILMTAICPHSAFNCSMVLSPELEYTVREQPLGQAGGMYVSVDGVRVDKLHSDGSVTVRKSGTAAKFIDLGLREFFNNLNQKLSWRVN